MTVHYDDIDVNEDILLDLPFREGTGAITQDVAKPHHSVDLIGAPTWTPLASNLMTLNMDGATQYLECQGADSADLDFTTHSYSIWGWLNWTVDDFSQIVIGRYELDQSGWELYLTQGAGGNYLSLRHHHGGTRTAAYSLGWTPGVDWFFGVVRFGTGVFMIRNGVAVTVTTSVGGLQNPGTCNEDLVIGARFTKDNNFLKGMLWRPRVAGGLGLNGIITPNRFNQVYAREGVWF